MAIYKANFIKQFPNGTMKIDHITFEADQVDFATALATFVDRPPEFHDCHIVDEENKAPCVFAITAYLKSMVNECSFVPSDFGGYTYNEFKKNVEEMTNNSRFSHFSREPLKCKPVKSKSGKAGETFNLMSKTWLQSVAFACPILWAQGE
jgi:hypothetical protein